MLNKKGLGICVLAILSIAIILSFVYAILSGNEPNENLLSPANLIIPPASMDLTGTNNLFFNNGVYEFTYIESGQELTKYKIDINDADVQRGLLRVYEEITDSYPVYEGGTKYRRLNGNSLTPLALSQQAAINVFTHSFTGLNNQVLRLYYEETVEGKITKKQFDISIIGKTLMIDAKAVEPDLSPFGNYLGFKFGRTLNTPNARNIEIGYMEFAPITIAGNPGSEYFISNYLDYPLSGSNANLIREGPITATSEDSFINYFSTDYVPGDNNRYPSFDEIVYITVSEKIEDTFARINRNPSAYRQNLSKRVAYDDWGIFSNFWQIEGATHFEKSEKLIKLFGGYGMQDLLIIFNVWQYFDYDCGLPTHYPANTLFGGGQNFINLISAAQSHGYLFAAHHNYMDMYLQSTYYNESELAKRPNGTYQPTWNNPSCSIGFQQSYKTRPERRIYYGNIEANAINQYYNPDAVFIDVTTSLSLTGFIDYAENSQSFTFKEGFANNMQLNQQQKNIYEGPLFGEGRKNIFATDSFQAGEGGVDGTEREIVGGKTAVLIPDFELREMKRLMANHGMGYHGRWADGLTHAGLNYNPLTFDFDKYRAFTIAYGHTGFMGQSGFGVYVSEFNILLNYFVKEYYTLRDLQEQYLSSDVENVRYFNGSDFIDLGQAVIEGVDFKNAQIKINYDNGLEIYVNGDDANIWLVDINGQIYYLPSYGWAAWNNNPNLLAYSALVAPDGTHSPSGNRVDYVRTDNYIMIDGRGVMTNFGFDYFDNPLVFDEFKVLKINGWSLIENNDLSFSTSDEICPSSIIEGGEQCDDGNNMSWDGCSQFCRREVGWDCITNSGQPSICVEVLAVSSISHDTVLNNEEIIMVVSGNEFTANSRLYVGEVEVPEISLINENTINAVIPSTCVYFGECITGTFPLEIRENSIVGQNPMPFIITSPTPSITNISPYFFPSTLPELTINGDNFMIQTPNFQGSALEVSSNGGSWSKITQTNGPFRFVNSQKVTTSLFNNSLPGNYRVRITNPGPNLNQAITEDDVVSQPLNLTVHSSCPAGAVNPIIGSISPIEITSDSQNTITLSGFNLGSNILVYVGLFQFISLPSSTGSIVEFTIPSNTLSPGTYSVFAIDNNGCFSSEQISLQINPPVSIQNSQNNEGGGGSSGGGGGGGGITTLVKQCNDNRDNDNDGLKDLEDPGCTSRLDNSEIDSISTSTVSECNDGNDNDGDGLSDYLDDPGCESYDDDDEIDLVIETEDEKSEILGNKTIFRFLLGILICGMILVVFLIIKEYKKKYKLESELIK